MNDAIELAKQALADAENVEKYTSELLAEVQKKLVGTVRLFPLSNRGDKGVSLVHFLSVKRTPPYGRSRSVIYVYNQVQVLVLKQGGHSLKIIIREEDTLKDSFDFLQAPEVELGVFKELTKEGSALVVLFLERLKERNKMPSLAEEKPPADIILDFPHIKLEYGAICVLGDSPYSLPGNLYLITPESLKFALGKLNDADEDLCRVSVYAESCDQRYISSRRIMLTQLRTLVTTTPPRACVYKEPTS
jgi:hypothetical protein